MKIVPETLRKLRTEKGLSQQGLADRAGIDKKTVARIEGGRGGETRGATVMDIAKVLGVTPQVLAEGLESEAMRDEDLRKHGYRKANLHFRDETILAYDLVRDRYGVDMWEIIDAAPLLFTLLAEMSLADRRRRLEEMAVAWAAYEPTVPEHLRYDAGGRDSEGFMAEEDSIEKRDLFARRIVEEDELGLRANESYYEDDRNPFSDFLITLTKQLGHDNDAIDCEHMYLLGGGLCGWRLFQTYQKRLTGGSSRADYALSRGYVRLAQIPRHLRGEDEDDEHVAEERAKWLEAHIPDDDWAAVQSRRPPLRLRALDLETSVSPSESDKSKKGDDDA